MKSCLRYGDSHLPTSYRDKIRPDIKKSTGPRSVKSGGPMKTHIVPVLLSGKKFLYGALYGDSYVKKNYIRSCKSFGGPVKLGFSMWLPVLRSGKGPKFSWSLYDPKNISFLYCNCCTCKSTSIIVLKQYKYYLCIQTAIEQYYTLRTLGRCYLWRVRGPHCMNFQRQVLDWSLRRNTLHTRVHVLSNFGWYIGPHAQFHKAPW